MKKALLILAGVLFSPLIIAVIAVAGMVTLISATIAAYTFYERA